MPPRYDRTASIVKKNTGISVLPAQAINISGGINPRSDSEAKNTPNIIGGLKVVVIKVNKSLKSIKNSLINHNDSIKMKIGNRDFPKLDFTNE